jgi:Tripartite tricarboxylate transporter family receptor
MVTPGVICLPPGGVVSSSFIFSKSFTAATAAILMVVHPQFPARSVPEFVAYAKANPGRLNIGTPGAGTRCVSSSNCSMAPCDYERHPLAGAAVRDLSVDFIGLSRGPSAA